MKFNKWSLALLVVILCPRVCAEGTASNAKQLIEFCRPHLEWPNWQPNMDVDKQVQALIQQSKAMNSDTIVHTWDQGGYALYPSDVVPMDWHINGRDFLGTLEREAHRNGLKFAVAFLGVQASQSYNTHAHPEWVQKDRNGQPQNQWAGIGYNFLQTCLNAPLFRDQQRQIVEEVLRRYRVDAVYLEGVLFDKGCCFDSYCQDRFRAMYGKDLLTADAATLQEFQQRSVHEFKKIYRDAIDGFSPQTVLYTGTPFDPEERDIADAVMSQAWGRSSDDASLRPFDNGLRIQMHAAEAKKPMVVATQSGKWMDGDLAPRVGPDFRQNAREVYFHGATLQVHTQNSIEADPAMIPSLRQVFTEVEKLRPYMVGAQLRSYAAIVYKPGPGTSPIESATGISGAGEPVRGIYFALVQNHIPVRVMTMEDLEAGHFGGCQVLVLANIRELSDAAVDRIEQFVRAGGGVVMTGETGQGNKRIEDLAGIRRISSEGPARLFVNYFRVTDPGEVWGNLRGTLSSWYGPGGFMHGGTYQKVECLPGTRVAAWVLDIDRSRMDPKNLVPIPPLPGEPLNPLVTMRKAGKGRVAYIATDLWTDDDPREGDDPVHGALLASAIRWAGQDNVPVQTTCPPMVEVITWAKDYSLAVLLLNEYIATLGKQEVRICLDGRKPKSVSSLSGQRLKTSMEGQWLVVQLEELGEAEGILINW